jgi:hypothetical protein
MAGWPTKGREMITNCLRERATNWHATEIANGRQRADASAVGGLVPANARGAFTGDELIWTEGI